MDALNRRSKDADFSMSMPSRSFKLSKEMSEWRIALLNSNITSTVENGS